MSQQVNYKIIYPLHCLETDHMNGSRVRNEADYRALGQAVMDDPAAATYELWWNRINRGTAERIAASMSQECNLYMDMVTILRDQLKGAGLTPLA